MTDDRGTVGAVGAGDPRASDESTETHIAQRFVFLLKQHEQFLSLVDLRCADRAPADRSDPELDEEKVWTLLLLSLPRPAQLQMDFSQAYRDIAATLAEEWPALEAAMTAGPGARRVCPAAVAAWVEAVRSQPQKRIAFYDQLERLARANGVSKALDLLAAKLRKAGHAKLAASVPACFVPAVSFHNLCALEAAWLCNNQHDELATVKVQQAGTQREPWVESPARDYLGLALSGGGIRSATFNLGMLQGLAELEVLQEVDYVSTVSGGGYIGGFWTAFRHQSQQQSQNRDQNRDQLHTFPRAALDSADPREHASVRHLREFSRFLIPRVGFAQPETWNAIVVTVGGAIASLTALTAAIALCLYTWQFATRGLASLPALWGACIFGLVTWVALSVMQYRLWYVGKIDAPEKKSSWPWRISLLAGASAFTAWWGLGTSWWARPLPTVDLAIGTPGSHIACIFAPAAAWGLCALLLYLLRGLSSRWSGLRFSTVLDRSIGRLLALATLVGALGAVWLLGDWLLRGPSVKIGALGSLGAISAGVFVWLSDWLKAPVQETRGSLLVGRFARIAKPILPQLAANTASVLMVTGVAMLVHHYGFGDPVSYGTAARGLAGSAAVVILACFFFDPSRTGLHDFYRARLSRCFLGAAQAKADQSPRPRPQAVTVEREEDEITLGQLRKARHGGPLHLICCAANNLSGDVLGNLYRGARSAVLSPFGVAVGSVSAPNDTLRLSAALTASAAAFNSQMGNISINLGPAVAFVMCALNLRLGLWVPHPANPKAHWKIAPGWHFFLEALGVSRSDQINSPGFLASTTLAMRAASYLDRYASKLHLSDGGHFENLGLYELIRRHCRYVIVSDASADADLSFDDLGNAIRRVREDFGVEIELDAHPLQKCEDGFSGRHAVIGTIHYDGPEGTDKGTLIYFKPTLTGDEPVDVIEHRRRCPNFPHDGTGDQFYDEAQWESYRRLGQHSVSSVLRMPVGVPASSRVDRMFMLANQRWQAAPRDDEKVSLGLVERSQAFEAAVRDSAPAYLRAEFFPEVATALRGLRHEAVAGVDAPATATALPSPSANDGGSRAATVQVSSEDVTRAAYFVMHAAQLMEDIWLAADLDGNASHPLNEGWMSYFHRWAATPTFRTWWPVLRPLHSPGFRDFIKERFDLRLSEPSRGERGGVAALGLRKVTCSSIRDLACAEWLRRFPGGLSDSTQALAYEMKLHAEGGIALSTVLVGLLVYTPEPGGAGVSWASTDLFVPPMLIGGGIIYRFLDAIIDRFAGSEMRVTIRVNDGKEAAGNPPLGAADRQRLRELIAFYHSRDFRRSGPRGSDLWVRRRAQNPVAVGDPCSEGVTQAAQ
jgi:patatin-like phospholipase